jgi:hypothetical protein
VALDGWNETPRGRRPLCGECDHAIGLHLRGSGRCRALACECARWSEPTQQKLWDEDAAGTPVTLASLRYAALPEGLAQSLSIDDALLETLERLRDYDDEAPASEAFVRDLLERVRLWNRHELWRVLRAGDMGADELLAELQRRDACH